jgi:hypothetical protein
MPSQSYTNPLNMFLVSPVKSHIHHITNSGKRPFQIRIIGHTAYKNLVKTPLGQVDGISLICWAKTITSFLSIVIEYAPAHPDHALVALTTNNLVLWKMSTSLSFFQLTLNVKLYATYNSSSRVTNKVDTLYSSLWTAIRMTCMFFMNKNMMANVVPLSASTTISQSMDPLRP